MGAQHDDDARLVGVLREDQVPLAIVEALVPAAGHGEERRPGGRGGAGYEHIAGFHLVEVFGTV